MEKIDLSGICKRCAQCCKNYPFVELSDNEIHILEQVTDLHLDVFTNSKGKAVEEYFLQFQENGDCFFLDENNGSYSCSVYDSRPLICKNYPSVPVQLEVCEANRINLNP